MNRTIGDSCAVALAEVRPWMRAKPPPPPPSAPASSEKYRPHRGGVAGARCCHPQFAEDGRVAAGVGIGSDGAVGADDLAVGDDAALAAAGLGAAAFSSIVERRITGRHSARAKPKHRHPA